MIPIDAIRAHDGYGRGFKLPKLAIPGAGINVSDPTMRRVVLFTLLAASVLFAGILQAQRIGGGSRRGVARASVGSGLRGHRGIRPGNFRSRSGRNAGIDYPFGYDWYGPYDNDDQPIEYGQAAPPFDAPPFMVRQPESRRVTQAPPAASPKVIELADTENSSAAKPGLLAIFILTNGERLETRRYLLTHESLYLTIDRQQRIIPLAQLDLTATVAADHERGIDLRIPDDGNEISVSF
jgi:hypothetical protein